MLRITGLSAIWWMRSKHGIPSLPVSMVLISCWVRLLFSPLLPYKEALDVLSPQSQGKINTDKQLFWILFWSDWLRSWLPLSRLDFSIHHLRDFGNRVKNVVLFINMDVKYSTFYSCQFVGVSSYLASKYISWKSTAFPHPKQSKAEVIFLSWRYSCHWVLELQRIFNIPDICDDTVLLSKFHSLFLQTSLFLAETILNFFFSYQGGTVR